MVTRHRNRIGITEKIGGVKHDDVQRMALDPFAAIKESPQGAHRCVDLDTEQGLYRVHGAHLIRDRTDPTNPSNDVEDLARATPAQ
jgi:hypothetical protein